MSDSGKAVFLSYASQDAEAAKRICEALRAAGVEVWFDQNELVGGDAWDQKIRKQIKDCALLIPIISANTQSRTEGYFRLEWRLADQRTHLMAKGRPFLLPVVVDGTKDSDAHVPDSFLEVQWTKAPDGEVSAAFVAQVKRLLDGGPSSRAAGSRPPTSASPELSPPRSQRPRWLGGRALWTWLGPALVIALITGFVVLKQSSSGTARSSAIAAGAETEGWKQAQRAIALLRSPEGINRARLEAADEFCKRALELDSTDGRILAAAAIVDAKWFYYQMDRSEARQQQAKSRVARAVVLAPGAPETQFAQALVYANVIGTPAMMAEAEKLLRGLAESKEYGRDAQVELGTLYRDMGRGEAAGRVFEQLGDLGSAGWAYWMAGKPDEVLRVADALLQRRRSLGALRLKGYVMLKYRWDLAATQQLFDQFTPEELQQDSPALDACYLALAQRDTQRLLEVAGGFPREAMSGPFIFCLKRYFTGWGHRLAGRPELAQSEWRLALATLHDLLKDKPNDPELLTWQARLQAWVGDAAVADSLRQYLSLAPESERGWTALTQMLVAVGQGRNEDALNTLVQFRDALQAARECVTILRFSPEFDALHGDQRFQQFLRDNLLPGAKPLDDQKTEVGGQRTAPDLKSSTSNPTPDSKSIAVLPFENMSEDKDSGYFADGVQEDILTNLASLKELRVISRTSVERYRKTDKPVPQIARELGVAYLLEGSVRRAGNKVRVTGQLIRAATDEHLWAKSFDRDLSDIFAIQSELAQAIAAELKTAISPAEAARVERRPTNNLEAYDLYLRAREIYSRMGAIVAQEPAQREIDLLQRAVKLDPQFVRAWEGLATAHANLYGAAIDRSPDRLHRANAALAEIVKLAPDSREAHEARGSIAYALREYPKAFEENEWVREHYPQEAHPVFTRGIIARRLGRWTEALATLKRAAEMDPASIVIAQNIALHLYEMRRYDEARAAYRRVGELRPEELEPGRLPAGLGTLDFLARGSTAEGDAYFAALSSSELATPAMAAQRKGWALLKGDFAGFEALATQFPELDDAPNRAPILAQRGADPAAVRALLEPFMARCRDNLLRQPDNAFQRLSLAWSEAVAGDRTRARADVEAAMAGMPAEKDAFEGRFLRTYASAVYAWIGDRDQANNLLAESLQVPPAQSARLVKVSLLWLPLHDDPRFQALVNDPKNNAPIY